MNQRRTIYWTYSNPVLKVGAAFDTDHIFDLIETVDSKVYQPDKNYTQQYLN